jgi:hypothetical protein
MSLGIHIYRIIMDCDLFAKVVPRDPLAFASTYGDAFSGRPIAIPLHPIRCTVDDRAKPLAQIGALTRASLTVTRDVAIESSHYEAAGQMIPILVDSTAGYVLNVTHICNALDRNAGHPFANEYRFLTARIGGPYIFKLPETASDEILTWTSSPRDSDSFVYECQQQALSGIRFELLWP